MSYLNIYFINYSWFIVEKDLSLKLKKQPSIMSNCLFYNCSYLPSISTSSPNFSDNEAREMNIFQKYILYFIISLSLLLITIITFIIFLFIEYKRKQRIKQKLIKSLSKKITAIDKKSPSKKISIINKKSPSKKISAIDKKSPSKKEISTDKKMTSKKILAIDKKEKSEKKLASPPVRKLKKFNLAKSLPTIQTHASDSIFGSITSMTMSSENPSLSPQKSVSRRRIRKKKKSFFQFKN